MWRRDFSRRHITAQCLADLQRPPAALRVNGTHLTSKMWLTNIPAANASVATGLPAGQSGTPRCMGSDLLLHPQDAFC
jgi:hypothetical protein